MTVSAPSPDATFAVDPEVMSRELDGQRVLLHAGRGTYFNLDPVGTRIWALLAEGRRLGEVHETLLAEYEVEAGELWRDLGELVRELIEQGLLRWEGEG